MRQGIRKGSGTLEEGRPGFKTGRLLVDVPMTPKQKEIITRLVQGNLRFSEDRPTRRSLTRAERERLAHGQKPDAVIHSCGDSRVSPNEIFDQQAGTLFIGRVAGNVIDSQELGNIEYAAEHLRTPVIIVMGHTQCGAVIAACGDGSHGENIGAIVEKIKPVVKDVKKRLGYPEPGVLLRDHLTEVVEQNVRQSVGDIKRSEIVGRLAEEGEVIVLGAVYDLVTGVVTFLKD